MGDPHNQAERKIGFWICTALVVGNTIGIGIFVLPASLAPYGWNALLGWVVTAAGCLVLAWVIARLAKRMPLADGPYAYIRESLGDFPAFVALWSYWVSIWITNAALATGVVGYLQAALPALAGVPPSLLALGLVWLFVAINLSGVRAGGDVQVATTILKLLPLLAVIGLGAWVLLQPDSRQAIYVPAGPLDFGGTLAASTIALFAMLGLESAAMPAAQVRDPERTIPRATVAGTALVAAICIAISATAMLLLPQDELAKSSAPLSALMDRHTGHAASRTLALFVVVSGLGALNGWTLLAGEVTRSMAVQRALPAWLARANARGVASAALWTTGGLASAMVLMSYSRSLVEGFTFLTKVVTAAALPLYLCCSLALLVLARRWKVSGALLAALGAAYSVFAFIGLGSEPFWLALLLTVAGLPLYFLLRRDSGNP